MVEARKPTREQIGQHRQREEEFERAAAELRPQWAPGTVGDAMADFQAAAALEQAEEQAAKAERLSVLPVEPSIVVEDELVRAAELTGAPARAPVKRRDAYPETYVGFAPTKPDADEDASTASRTSASSYGVRSAFAPGESVNAVPGAFAPSGFPALDDESSKSRLSQLGGGSIASLASRHGKLIAIVAGACLLLGVLVALFSRSDDAPVVTPQVAPVAPEKPPVAVTPLPVVEPPTQAKPVQPEPTRLTQPAAKKAPVVRAPVKAAVKAPVKAPVVTKPVAKAPLKAAPKAPVKPVAKAPVKASKPALAKPVPKPVKGKPAAQVKRERSPIDVLNPWGS